MGEEDRLCTLIFNSISDGVFTVSQKRIITSFNRAAERITGFKASEAIGRPCFDVFRTEICHKRCPLMDTLQDHDPVEDMHLSIITRDGCELPISVTTEVLKDDDGNLIGAVEFFRDISELELCKKRCDQAKVLDEIISVNPHMQKIIQMLPNVAESDCNVLIRGPSGSGKEVLAKVIHSLSLRKYGPYIKINCAALPATLLESELFGYSKGAFTDAKRDKPGHFCLANRGTLLLDEIVEMDVSLQVKLLRVLNNGEFQPLGSTKTLHTDARIITATNADLETAIREGRFREDLYFRINVVEIKIPPLKDRPEDIPLLVEHFLKLFKEKMNKPIQRISSAAIAVLRKYPFPGNVRELENAIEHAFVMCNGREILPEHLPLNIVNNKAENNNNRIGNEIGEKNLLEQTLRRNGGNKTKAAHELGMHRATLYRKIKMLGINIYS
jgi:PAS domain S-box-containing protein